MMLKKRPRAQFSLEFVLTYGWAFFIILAGISVIYSTGIFSFADFLPEKCDFLGQIKCAEAQITSTGSGVGSFKVRVSNDFGVDLVIYNATLLDAYGTSCTGGTGTQRAIMWPIDSTVEVNVSSCTGSRFNRNLRYEGNILLTYYRNNTWCSTPTNCLYTSVGQLTIKVN